MFTTTTRRSLLALASVGAGLASAVTPSVAYAEPIVQTAPQDEDAGTAASTCWSWTDYVTGPGYPYRVYIPSTTRNGGEQDCLLARGHATDGVYKLQDALNYCYGQGLERDGKFGPATEQAVRNVQRFHGFPENQIDGIYGPKTRAAMTWPKYRTDGAYDHCWR